ncbi:MAG: hypothetical protein R6V52_03705, partial [Bacteroidales bacterium]
LSPSPKLSPDSYNPCLPAGRRVIRVPKSLHLSQSLNPSISPSLHLSIPPSLHPSIPPSLPLSYPHLENHLNFITLPGSVVCLPALII